MTPRSIFTIIILAVTMLLGGALGYFIGNHKAIAAEKVIATDVTVGKVQDTANTQLVAQLQAQNKQLSADYAALQAQLQAKQIASDANWQQVVAKKDLALELATKNSTQAQVQVNALKASLFLAMTPDEKERVQKNLADAQAQLVELQARTDGLKCLSVQIPKEYLDATNAVVSAPATPIAVSTPASGVTK